MPRQVAVEITAHNTSDRELFGDCAVCAARQGRLMPGLKLAGFATRIYFARFKHEHAAHGYPRGGDDKPQEGAGLVACCDL